MSCPSLAIGQLIMFFFCCHQVNAIGTLHCGVLFQIAKIITCIIQTLKKGPADYKVIIYCTCLNTCVRSSMPGKKSFSIGGYIFILLFSWCFLQGTIICKIFAILHGRTRHIFLPYQAFVLYFAGSRRLLLNRSLLQHCFELFAKFQ